MQLPVGWRYRTLSQALVATSPDRDAALQLTIAEQEGPDEAAAEFLHQAGVTATGPVERDSINGSRAAVAPFRVTSAGSSAAGVAGWIAYGGRVYQLVGISGGQAGDGYVGAFRGTLGSFAPLSDKNALDVHPNRINIVRLGRATTFEDFNRRYPSVIDAEEVALLNRLAGAGARVPAGGRLKRVIRG
jgi:predicted Zn-dependent protease